MKKFAWVDENGFIIKAGQNRAVPEGAIEVPRAIPLEVLVKMRYVAGTWISPGAT